MEEIEKRVTNAETATGQIARSLAEQESTLYELKALTREQGRDIRELKLRYRAHEEYVTDRLNDFEERITEKIDGLGNRLSVLEAGQQQIIELLTGKPPVND